MNAETVRFPGRRFWFPVIFACILALTITACGDDDDDSAGDSLEISGAWSRPAVLLDVEEGEMDATAEEGAEMDMEGGGTNGVVYVTIENTGDEDDMLVAGSTDIAGTVELHNVNMVDGVMQMRQVEGGIELPAGETVALEPGGLHAMLIGLNRSLEVGDTFEIELEFEQASSMTIEVEVREP